MTLEDWKSLTAGSIVSNRSGKNHRVVISSSKWAIKLPSTRDRARLGYTVYCVSDRNMFLLVKAKVKIKKICGQV